MAITIQNHELQVTLKALGATMTSITDSQGVEYLWQGDATY
ncbi:TPA: aldose 1-epimerase family protein, partial [Streptococcus agalactiae]